MTSEKKKTDESKEISFQQEREKNIEIVVSTIEKQFGKGSLMRLREDESPIEKVEVIPSGSISLDLATGIGGYPKGRIIEIFGQEASGKTTLALNAIAEAQKAGGLAVFIDAEHALDINYARQLGIRTDDLLIAQPDFGEQALDIAETLVRSNSVDVLVVDSVAALVPKAELEGEMGDSHMGLQARLMSQALRKLTGSISKSKTCLIFINQTRLKIGQFFGNPETTTGGQALKFYSSLRLEIRHAGKVISSSNEPIGMRAKVKIVKNKLAVPFKEAEFDILWGKGINRAGEIVDIGDEYKIIEKSGSWYSYKGNRIGQGRERVIEFLKENPTILTEIEKLLYEKLSLH